MKKNIHIYIFIFIITALCIFNAACSGDSEKNLSENFNRTESSDIFTSSENEKSQKHLSSFGASEISSSSCFASSSKNENSQISVQSEIVVKPPESLPESAPESQALREVKITIPEGYTAPQIGELLEKNDICSKTEFLSVLNSYDFTYYPLAAKIPTGQNRCFKLEGYLFPDTYYFYNDNKPAADAVGVLLRGAEAKINGVYSYPGMSTDDIIKIASIIEKEADNADDMKKIASVFHNRLKKGMMLQADSTIVYVERYIKPNITGDVNRYNQYYNTYKCPALPSGPICNPGESALYAACNPADTEYLYFAVDENNKYYYASTYEEHLQNCTEAGIV